MMVGGGGTRTCIHPHVSRPLYHCATDATDFIDNAKTFHGRFMLFSTYDT